MIKSMTGYGKAQASVNGKDITVEIKSVNHRFFDFNTRIPRIYGFLEERLKSYLQKHINRGKLDVFVTIINTDDNAVEVSLDHSMLSGYIKAMNTMKDEYSLKDDISVSTVARFTDLFSVKKNEEDAEIIWEAVKTAADMALEGFLSMRIKEGERLKADIVDSCKEIEGRIKIIEERAPLTVKEYREKLTERIKELIGDISIDEGRLLTETAIFADKIAVNEEIVRLKSHINQFEHMINTDAPIGKKLDFIVQEMNREINTIGSKANDLGITQNVIEVKSEIENIREQIQNIE